MYFFYHFLENTGASKIRLEGEKGGGGTISVASLDFTLVNSYEKISTLFRAGLIWIIFIGWEIKEKDRRAGDNSTPFPTFLSDSPAPRSCGQQAGIWGVCKRGIVYLGIPPKLTLLILPGWVYDRPLSVPFLSPVSTIFFYSFNW